MAETETPSRAETAAAAWTPKFNPWLIAVVVALAAFMEVLDTSIANVALPHIAGNLGASNDESTWVLTSYLAANAIVLPISGWLAGRFGRKRFFTSCIVLFTASSLLCGAAPTLGILIVFRALRGVGGGGLQPMAQAILADTFPPEKRGLAFALYGITAVIAPTVGPTLGGWITDNYSWRWIFYINLPVGALAVFLVLRMLEDPPYLTLQRAARASLDYAGVALLAVGVAALQILLDKGQEEDWFGSRFIAALAATAAVCLVSLVIWELRHKAPILEVRLFKNFNFAASNLMMFILGVLYFASLVMMPQLLQTLMGYTATLAGLVLSGSGLVLLFEMPLVGQLTSRYPAKYIMSFGWLCMAAAMYFSAIRIDLLMSFGYASRLRIFQAFALGFLFVPITLSAYVGLPGEKSNAIAGMINFMRNMGSSVGTSLVTTLLARRAQFHQTVLGAHANLYNPAFRNQLSAAAAQMARSGASAADAQRKAYAALYRELEAQAQTLAYIDTFKVLAMGAGIMFALTFLLRKNDPRGGGARAMAE